MEQGWDRVRAASFAWESTAFPMLTGTLVTAAGFLPIGFANSARSVGLNSAKAGVSAPRVKAVAAQALMSVVLSFMVEPCVD
ncbi:MAG: hypothetical protein B7Y53_03060 [Halothiobacillus sp. 28-55-5]|nr:MAG: hypothetical protein B7Y53_03060 [Halothiobacillus sp. 28-55-5]